MNEIRIHIPLENTFHLIVQAWVVDMCSFRNASHASYLLATSSRYLRRYRVSRTWEMLSNEAAKMINQLTPDISSNDFWKNVVSFSMTHNVGFFFIWFPAINATQHSYFVILYIETGNNCFNTFNQSTKHILTSSIYDLNTRHTENPQKKFRFLFQW